MMVSAKMSTLGLLKIKVFWNKDYDVIIFVYDITNKILSDDSNQIKNGVTEAFITSILQRFDKKTTFLIACLGSSSITLCWH